MYTVAQLRQIGALEFRAEPTGIFILNRNGRRVPVTKGVEYVPTACGKFSRDEWHSLMEKAVKEEGLEDLLKKVIVHCERLAFLHTEQQVRRYALNCLASGAYRRWPEWNKGEKDEQGKEP